MAPTSNETSHSSAFPADDRALPAIHLQLAPLGYSPRPQHAGDLPWLRALYASRRAEELATVPWADAIKRAFLNHQFALQYQHYLSHFPTAVFLAIQHPSVGPVGRLYLQRSAPHHLLIDICLIPSLRQQGVGSALVRQCQAQAAALGHGMSLHVQHQNTGAQRLYQRLGFRLAEHGDSRWLMVWPADDKPVTNSATSMAG